MKTLNANGPADMRLFGKLTLGFTIVLCLIPMIAGIVLWDTLPDELVSSVSSETGEVLDHINKVFAIVVFPLLMALVTVIAAYVGRHREQFNNVNDKLMYITTWLPCMMSFTMCGTWYTHSLGLTASQNQLVYCIIGIILMCIGVSFMRVYRNWRYGYRTPHAMGGENNWRITQTTSGLLFILGGIAIGIEGLWFLVNPDQTMTFIYWFVGTIIVVLVPPYIVSIIVHKTVKEEQVSPYGKSSTEKKKSYKKTKVSSNSSKGNAGVKAIKAKKKQEGKEQEAAKLADVESEAAEPANAESEAAEAEGAEPKGE